MRISTTILSILHNKELYKIVDDKLIILAGEAYAAVPFYRSINMCLAAAEPTSQAILCHLYPVKVNSQQHSKLFVFENMSKKPKTVKEFANKIENIFSWESFRAKITNTSLIKTQNIREISASSYQKTEKISSNNPSNVVGKIVQNGAWLLSAINPIAYIPSYSSLRKNKNETSNEEGNEVESKKRKTTVTKFSNLFRNFDRKN